MKTNSNSFISLLLNYENIKSKDGILYYILFYYIFYYNCFLSKVYLSFMYMHLSLIFYICISCVPTSIRKNPQEPSLYDLV